MKLRPLMEHSYKTRYPGKNRWKSGLLYQPLKKLQKILDETESNWIERKKRLEEFMNKEVRTGEEDLAQALGFDNKEEFAFFEIVKKHLLEPEEKQEGIAAEAGAEYITQDIMIWLKISPWMWLVSWKKIM